MGIQPNPQRKRHGKRLAAPRHASPGKVVGYPTGDPQVEPPTDRPRSAMRFIDLTPDERKVIFARNLNQLLEVLGLDRKAASEQIQISYRWVRRMVSVGVSRPDERNRENLERLASYFCLPDTEALWTHDLVAALIASEPGRRFVEKFGPNISKLVREQVEQSGRIDKTLVDAWISTHGEPGQTSALNYDAKLAALVATGRHHSLRQLDAVCKRMVGEAYEKEFGEEQAEGNSCA